MNTGIVGSLIRCSTWSCFFDIDLDGGLDGGVLDIFVPLVVILVLILSNIGLSGIPIIFFLRYFSCLSCFLFARSLNLFFANPPSVCESESDEYDSRPFPFTNLRAFLVRLTELFLRLWFFDRDLEEEDDDDERVRDLRFDRECRADEE